MQFFIVGTGRCGTKMLRRMLLPNPRVEICIETHFLPTLYDEFGTDPAEFDEYVSVIDEHYDSAGRKWVDTLCDTAGKEYGRFPEEFRETCRHETADIATFTEEFHRYLFGRDVQVVGDKTPHYGTAMAELTELWPEAKFVHITRDGVYAADSMTRHDGFKKQIAAGTPVDELDRQSYRGQLAELPVEPIPIEQAADFWAEVIEETRRQGRRLADDQYMEVRYEDLLQAPEATLRSVGSFLGLEDGDWRRRGGAIPYPFYLHRMDRRVTDEEYRRVADRIDDTMRSFGYPTATEYDSLLTELRRSLRYYRYHVPDPDYWKTMAWRKLHP